MSPELNLGPPARYYVQKNMIRRQTVLQNRSRMLERYVCNFEMGDERRVTKGDKRRRSSRMM